MVLRPRNPGIHELLYYLKTPGAGIFSQGVELGLGASGPEDIEIVADDDKGGEYAKRLRETLLRG